MLFELYIEPNYRVSYLELIENKYKFKLIVISLIFENFCHFLIH
jgi:hypothetical protein